MTRAPRSKPTQASIRELSRDELDEITRSSRLDLDSATRDGLAGLVRRMVAAIERYRARAAEDQDLGGRAATLKQLKALSEAFDRLSALLAHPNANLAPVLRDVFAPVLSEMLEPEVFTRLLRIRLEYRTDVPGLGDFRGNGMEGPAELMQELRKEMAKGKRQVAREQTPRLLAGVVEQLHAPLRLHLALERQAKGGAPGQRERNFVVGQLADAFPALTGRKPTTTPSGRFVTLCELVLTSIGLDTTGLDKAIQRILKPKPKPKRG
jgi:hypothetical protein